VRPHYSYTRSQEDDAPLYVFDEDFADAHRKTRVLLDDFSPPQVFQEDLFQYLGEVLAPSLSRARPLPQQVFVLPVRP